MQNHAHTSLGVQGTRDPAGGLSAERSGSTLQRQEVELNTIPHFSPGKLSCCLGN